MSRGFPHSRSSVCRGPGNNPEPVPALMLVMGLGQCRSNASSFCAFIFGAFCTYFCFGGVSCFGLVQRKLTFFGLGFRGVPFLG